MKKLIAIVAMLSICQVAWAEFDLSVSPEVSHISYREKNLSVGLPQAITVKEDGVMYGIRGIAEYTDKFYLALDGKYSIGQVDYSGSGAITGIDDQMVEVRGLAGKQFKNVLIYSGYGYRHLSDNMGGMVTSDGSLGYDRESSYHYIPIGARLNIGKVVITGEVDPMISGVQKSYLDRLGVGFPLVTNKQERGVGFKVDAKYKGSINGLDVEIGPFLRGWKVQQSKESEGFVEPKNTSLEVGGGITLRW